MKYNNGSSPLHTMCANIPVLLCPSLHNMQISHVEIIAIQAQTIPETNNNSSNHEEENTITYENEYDFEDIFTFDDNLFEI